MLPGPLVAEIKRDRLLREAKDRCQRAISAAWRQLEADEEAIREEYRATMAERMKQWEQRVNDRGRPYWHNKDAA